MEVEATQYVPGVFFDDPLSMVGHYSNMGVMDPLLIRVRRRLQVRPFDTEKETRGVVWGPPGCLRTLSEAEIRHLLEQMAKYQEGSLDPVTR